MAMTMASVDDELDALDDGYTHDEPWKAHGLCTDERFTPSDFFVESLYRKNSPEYRVARDRAKAVCNVCIVKPQCLQYALRHDIRDGVWGGTTASERRNILHPRRRKPKPDPTTTDFPPVRVVPRNSSVPTDTRPRGEAARW